MCSAPPLSAQRCAAKCALCARAAYAYVIGGSPALACRHLRSPHSPASVSNSDLRHYPERDSCPGVRLLAEAVGARHGGGVPAIRGSPLTISCWSPRRSHPKSLSGPDAGSTPGPRPRPLSSGTSPTLVSRANRPASGVSCTYRPGGSASDVDALRGARLPAADILRTQRARVGRSSSRRLLRAPSHRLG